MGSSSFNHGDFLPTGDLHALRPRSNCVDLAPAVMARTTDAASSSLPAPQCTAPLPPCSPFLATDTSITCPGIGATTAPANASGGAHPLRRGGRSAKCHGHCAALQVNTPRLFLSGAQTTPSRRSPSTTQADLLHCLVSFPACTTMAPALCLRPPTCAGAQAPEHCNATFSSPTGYKINAELANPHPRQNRATRSSGKSDAACTPHCISRTQDSAPRPWPRASLSDHRCSKTIRGNWS